MESNSTSDTIGLVLLIGPGVIIAITACILAYLRWKRPRAPNGEH